MTRLDKLLEAYSQRIDEMHTFYVDAERQFIEFNEIVPYVKNDDDVYSPRLFSLLQYIHSQIDGTLKILAGLLAIEVKNKFDHYMRELNGFNMLTVQQIKLREGGKIFKPFELDSNHTTAWRTANNKAKHAMPEGAYFAKYGCVVNSLAALAILHEIIIKAQDLNLRPYILNEKNWYVNNYELFIPDTNMFYESRFCQTRSKIFDYPMSLYMNEKAETELQSKSSST